jgi:hypothetical protein
MLLLADGEEIVLDNADDGLLTKHDEMQVNKKDGYFPFFLPELMNVSSL